MLKNKSSFLKRRAAFLKLHTVFALLMILLLANLLVNKIVILDPLPKAAMPTYESRLSRQGFEQKRYLVDLLHFYQAPFNLQDKWQMAELIFGESRKRQLDPRLVLALISIESGFDLNARSGKNARGVMQLLHPTAEAMAQEIGLQVANFNTLLYDPYLNIRLGIHYLAKLIQRFGNLELALVAYNIGPTRLEQLQANQENIPKAFSRRVIWSYRQIQKKSPLDF